MKISIKIFSIVANILILLNYHTYFEYFFYLKRILIRVRYNE
jgi:hypothetical protein